MLCYWGEAVKPAGFDLVKAGSVKFTDTGIGYIFPKFRIRDVSPGKSLVGFIRWDGNASVMRLNTRERVGKLKQVEHKNKIRLISCGEADAVLLSGGTILSLAKSNVCRPIKDLSKKTITIIQVACGNKHFMALTNDGQLFTWGQNSSGQLGLGKDEPISTSPQRLKSLCGIPLAQISAGGDQSFALSLSGAVFGWGRNNAGQLGLGHKEDMYIPTCVNTLNQKQTISISCGKEHTATLSKGGTVFTFGSGRYGQLGHNSFNDELQPRVVSGLWGINVSQITCGRTHTLALVESSNTIYSFGCGEQGQLGNGQRTNQCVPLPVQLPPEANNTRSVERIIAGGNQSFVLCSPQKSDSNSEPNRRRGIVTLGVKMIDRWVSKCESQWGEIKKEIEQIFSSLACINGSFIVKSCDGHYRTSTHVSGLDLETARAAFERLAEKEKILLEVEKVIEKDLLPSLSFPAAGVEALRIFLILPELLRVLNKQGHETSLRKLCSAILNLDPHMRSVLENFWSELPDAFLKRLLELFHTSAAKMISAVTFDYRQKDVMDAPLRNSVQVLHMLYKASCRNQRAITTGDFIIYEINDLVDMLHALQKSVNDLYGIFGWIGDIDVMTQIQQHMHTFEILSLSPSIFTLEAKCSLLKFRKPRVPFRMELRRTALLEDCFQQLRAASEQALKGWLQVVYCENLEQSDVNKRDFFHNAFKTLLDPESEMFMYNDTKTLIWFPVELNVPKERYFFLGVLCGLAFYNNGIVHMPFPLALFKKLLDIKPSLEDFAELSPVIGQSMKYLLNYSDDDADNMYMTYTISWNNKEVELDPDEPGKAVTSSNKNLFVDAYVDYVLNTSVEQVFDEFKKGFYKVCDRNMVNFFQPEELRGVMLGSEEYDWDIFKKNATYEYVFHASHPTIVTFWEVFEKLSSQDKKAFLLFLTGFDRVPVLGMGQVKMRVRPLFNSTQDYLPQALTCHAILDLPVYQTKEILQMKLIEAIYHRRGFWED